MSASSSLVTHLPEMTMTTSVYSISQITIQTAISHFMLAAKELRWGFNYSIGTDRTLSQ